jgi:RNA polymerase sigma factor (sigma-70 family)
LAGVFIYYCGSLVAHPTASIGQKPRRIFPSDSILSIESIMGDRFFMDDEEIILVSRLQKREESAWETFCRNYSGPLLSAVRLQFSCAPEMAEEIVQLAFIRCVNAIHTFDPARGRLFDWLKAIARNEAYSIFRKTSNHRWITLDPLDQEWIEHIDQTSPPDERLCLEEVRLFILDTVMGLDHHHRQALIMKYLENRRVAEMATVLGQSEKAVESLLTRSRQAFRELLRQRCQQPANPGSNGL